MSSIMKGIVDEGQDVAVIYIDGKPSVKYAKKHEATADAERLREKFPNKKIEIKDEFREDDDLEELDENLRKWFKEKWVRFGPDGKIRGACARGSSKEGKPKCLPQSKAHSIGKKGRKYAAAKKRREDPNPERRGPAKNVATKKKSNEDINEGIPFNECPECRGPIVHESMMNEKQDACYHKVKARYKVWPSAYASGALVQCRKKGAKNWGNKSKKNESINESFLAEGKFLIESRVTRKLWESAGQKIVEAQLTQDQIMQIFQAAEQGQTAGGANRTIAGKGKDAASAVNRAWEDLKTKIQNTGPIQNMDAMYDKAAEAMKKSTGGDQGAMQYVQKYRDFAKKHPIAQSFLYAALIAAAGLSGAGLGGAAALGLLKMTDKLLQGEKFSSALYRGGVTGALAYGAARIGDLLRGSGTSGTTGPNDEMFIDNPKGEVPLKLPDGKDIIVNPGDTLSQIAQKNNVSVKDLLDANKDILNPDVLATGQQINVPNATGNPTYQGGVGTAADTAAKVQSGQYAPNPMSVRNVAKAGLSGTTDQLDQAAAAAKSAAKQAASAAADQGIDTSPAQQVAKSAFTKVAGEVVDPSQPLSPLQMATVNAGKQMGTQYSQDVIDAYNLAVEKGVKPYVGSVINRADGSIIPSTGKNSFNFESRQLSKYEVFKIMEAAALCQTVLNEGLMDTIKGAAGKAAQWAKTKGHNITTKVTADKLMQAWKKAGSPTDSEDVRAVLQSAGVTDNVIASVMPAGTVTRAPAAEPAGKPLPSPAAMNAQPAAGRPITNKATAPAAAPAKTATQPTSAMAQGVAQAGGNVNPELYNRLAARKAGKPVYAGGLEEGVIVSHDSKDPEVRVLGGAGTMSLSRLKKKAKAEADLLANDLAKGAFKAAAHNIKQLENTLATIKAAEAEMEKKYFGESEESPYQAGYKAWKDYLAGKTKQRPVNPYPAGQGMGAWERGAGDAAEHLDWDTGNLEEDYTGEFAAENTPAINPYGGLKDRQHRGAISETPTDNPTGASGEGGWRRTDNPELDEACWKGYHKEGMKTMFGKKYPNCVKNTNEEALDEYREMSPELKAAQQNLLALRNKQKATNVPGKRAPRDRTELDKPKPATVLTKGSQEVDPATQDAIAAFLAKGGEIKKGRPGKAPPVGRNQASKHIGGAGTFKRKGDRPGLGANYRGDKIVAVEEEQLDEKCWDTHKQVGMKKKGGKMVPNCVPKESAILKGIKNRLV